MQKPKKNLYIFLLVNFDTEMYMSVSPQVSWYFPANGDTWKRKSEEILLPDFDAILKQDHFTWKWKVIYAHYWYCCISTAHPTDATKFWEKSGYIVSFLTSLMSYLVERSPRSTVFFLRLAACDWVRVGLVWRSMFFVTIHFVSK